MKNERKLPPPDVLYRLYWLEDWTTTEIARQYRCCRDTVYQGIVRAGIPVKRRRRPAQCRVCGDPVCLIKVYRRNRRGYAWLPTYWCAAHYMAERRRWERDALKRRYARLGRSPRPYRRGPLPGVVYGNWIRELPA